jgi:hypothetical protein
MTLKETIKQFEALFAADKASGKSDAGLERAGNNALYALRAADGPNRQAEKAKALEYLETYFVERSKRGR